MNTPFTLPDQHIHIWLVDPTTVTDPSLLDQYHQLMTLEERAKWQRYRFDKDKHQHLVTRALIRHTLSRYEPGVAPSEWRFTQNKHGKPEIDNPIRQPLFFNLSHTQNLAALAVTRSCAVGVDVERIKSVDQVRGLAERCFTDEENAYIFQGNQEAILWRFFKLWTLKEAYLKAVGCGMSLSLQSLNFSPTAVPLHVQYGTDHDEDAGQWNFRIWQAGPEHLMSIAMNLPRQQLANAKMFRVVPLQEFTEIACDEIIGR